MTKFRYPCDILIEVLRMPGNGTFKAQYSKPPHTLLHHILLLAVGASLIYAVSSPFKKTNPDLSSANESWPFCAYHKRVLLSRQLQYS